MIIIHGGRRVRLRAKVRDQDNIRGDPLIVMRNALADRWFVKYRNEMFKVLNAQVREASARVARGSTEPVTDSMETRWTEELVKAKRKPVSAMVRSGTELTDAMEFGKKSMNYFPGVLGPDVNPFAGKADYVGLEAVGYDEDDIFLHQAQTQNVEEYIQETSKMETATSRKKIDKLYKDANSYWDPVLKRGRTPVEVAKQMQEQGLAGNANRATLMARTTTMWAYNEGAHQSYLNAGVPAETWVVAQDDVLCEFCVQMDGQTVRTEDPFVPAGTEFPGLDGGVMNIPTEWPISHPPLHPMCRCTLVPVILPAQAAVSLKAGDKLRDDYTKKIADGTMKEARASRARLLRRRRKPKKAVRKKVPKKKEPVLFEDPKMTKKVLEKKPDTPHGQIVRDKLKPTMDETTKTFNSLQRELTEKQKTLRALDVDDPRWKLARKEVPEIQKKLESMNLKLQEKLMKAMRVDDPVQINYSVLNKSIPSEHAKIVKKAFKDLESIISKKGAGVDTINVKIKVDAYGSRAYYSSDGVIHVSAGSTRQNIIHEFGHHLEASSSDVGTAARRFFSNRTVGEKAVKLSDITGVSSYASETTKVDKFFNSYVGHVYEGKHTEVMSMGLEQMFTSPGALIRGDAGHFDLVVNALRGIR